MFVRIFYLSWIGPIEGNGATLAMRRHFVEHRDFEVFVATTTAFAEAGISSLKVVRPKWLQRLSDTRFVRAVRNFELLVHGTLLPGSVIEAAKGFRPDAVFTVADMTLSEQARKLAKKLGVPLVVNFQDWWPRGQFYYGFEKPYFWVRPILERRFRRLYREAELAFCTSEGMKEFLGPHPNAHVLYPIGASEDQGNEWRVKSGVTGVGAERKLREAEPKADREAEARSQGPDVNRSAAQIGCKATKDQVTDAKMETGHRKKRLIYTGTAFGGYGRMLRELARELEKQDEWELVIFGNTPDWPKKDLEEAKRSGLYRGLLKFADLQRELHKADACLAVMSFGPELKVMMRTSFTTKLLDYCRVRKPIILWGPEYCSPMRLAKSRDAALCIERCEATNLVEGLAELGKDVTLQRKLVDGAKALAEQELSHDHIHSGFVNKLMAVGHSSESL
jgi:glycosyltransferase involved in cell wall biosynthesis